MRLLPDLMVIIRDISQITADMVQSQVDKAADTGKKAVTRVLKWLLVAAAATIIALGGLAIGVWGGYLVLCLAVGPAAAAFILGGALLVIAVALFLAAGAILKD